MNTMPLTFDEQRQLEAMALNISITVSGGWQNGYRIALDGDGPHELASHWDLPFSVAYHKHDVWGTVCLEEIILANDRVSVSLEASDIQWMTSPILKIKGRHVYIDQEGPWNADIRSMLDDFTAKYDRAMQEATDAQQAERNAAGDAARAAWA